MTVSYASTMSLQINPKTTQRYIPPKQKAKIKYTRYVVVRTTYYEGYFEKPHPNMVSLPNKKQK